jgi:hypothetical protein
MQKICTIKQSRKYADNAFVKDCFQLIENLFKFKVEFEYFCEF